MQADPTKIAHGPTVWARAYLLDLARNGGRHDMGGQDFNRAKQLARWWGLAIQTRALGGGSYAISIAPSHFQTSEKTDG